ncbi:MAG: hypothetical protein ACYCQI_14950 [Gammaproteobacteria bacterium]
MNRFILAMVCLCLSSVVSADFKVKIFNASNDHTMEIEFRRCTDPSRSYFECESTTEKITVASSKLGGKFYEVNVQDNHLIQVISVEERNTKGMVVASGINTQKDILSKPCASDLWNEIYNLVLDDMNGSSYIRCNGRVFEIPNSD